MRHCAFCERRRMTHRFFALPVLPKRFPELQRLFRREVHLIVFSPVDNVGLKETWDDTLNMENLFTHVGFSKIDEICRQRPAKGASSLVAISFTTCQASPTFRRSILAPATADQNSGLRRAAPWSLRRRHRVQNSFKRTSGSPPLGKLGIVGPAH